MEGCDKSWRKLNTSRWKATGTTARGLPMEVSHRSVPLSGPKGMLSSTKLGVDCEYVTISGSSF